MNNEEIISRYVRWLQSWGASKRTVTAREATARSRLRAWGLSGMTAENIQNWIGRPDLSPWSRSTYHATMTCFCGWLVATGHLADNPMVNVRKGRRPPSSPRPLSEVEVKRVLAVVEGDVRTWILLALLAGLRASEIAKISGQDVTSDDIFVLGKGGKPVTLPCHEDLWELAQRYPTRGYWFPGNDEGHMRPQQISLTVGKLFTSLGIDGSIHRLRHVYGTRLLRRGVHIRTVQKLMRHSSLDTTANYTAVDEDEMRAAIRLLSA